MLKISVKKNSKKNLPTLVPQTSPCFSISTGGIWYLSIHIEKLHIFNKCTILRTHMVSVMLSNRWGHLHNEHPNQKTVVD